MSSSFNKNESLSVRASILKTNKIQLTSNNTMESKNNCCVTPTGIGNQDFYGNYLTPKKKHTVFFNTSANKTHMVENWKEYNLDPNNNPQKGKLSKKPKDDICTIF